MVYLFESLFCFVEGVLGAICSRSIEMLFWIFIIWNKLAPFSSKQSRNQTKGAPGDANIGSRGEPPRDSEQQVANKNIHHS